MPKVNSAVVGCSSSNYGINKWKKEPCLEHGDKNVVKKQCRNCERPYSLCCFPAEMTKGKERDTWIQALKQENTNTTECTPKAVIGFVHYILQMEFQLKQNDCQPCILITIQKDKKLDPLFSNTRYQRGKLEQKKVKWKLESSTMK